MMVVLRCNYKLYDYFETKYPKKLVEMVAKISMDADIKGLLLKDGLMEPQ